MIKTTNLIIKEKVDAIASKYSYKQIDFQENIGLVIYRKNDVKINVYLSKMTVATCLDHPKQGKTQMFRRNISLELLEKLFINPRFHSGKGYQTIKNRQ